MSSSDRYLNFGVIGGAVFFAITSLAQPFFALYAAEIGASTLSIGLMITLRSFLPMFFAIPTGQLIDSLGPMKLVKVGCFLLILSLVTTVISTSLILLSLSQLLLGSSIIIVASSLQVLVSNGEKNERNEGIKRYSMWVSGGTMMGPLIGGGLTTLFADPLSGYRFAFWTSSIVSAIFLLFVFVIARGYQHRTDDSPLKASEILNMKGIAKSYTYGFELTKKRSVQFGLTATFLIMYIQSIYLSFMPLYLKELGYATMIITIIISLNGLAGMLSRYLLTWIMRTTKLERIMIITGFIAAINLTLTPIGALHFLSVAVIALAIGTASGINFPASIMIMVNDTKENERGKIMGLRLFMNRFSQIVSPAMFGVLGQAMGLATAFYTGGALLIATMAGFSVYTSSRLRKEAKDAEDA